jgi:alcohol dehydrogenase class IV
MQYPIGAMTDTSHAAGLTALYPTWIGYEYEVNSDKVRNVARWLGYGNIESPHQAKEAMKSFQNELGIGYTLETLGVSEDNIESMVDSISGNLANDRLYTKKDIIKTIYKDSL